MNGFSPDRVLHPYKHKWLTALKTMQPATYKETKSNLSEDSSLEP